MNSPTAHKEQQNQQSQATVRLALWTAAWLLMMAIAVFGSEFLWPNSKALAAFATVVHLAVGIGMILANKHHLHTLDEMHQKIQLEAMGITLGVGFVLGFSYSVADIAGLLATRMHISYFAVAMALTYIVSIVVGFRRYH